MQYFYKSKEIGYEEFIDKLELRIREDYEINDPSFTKEDLERVPEGYITTIEQNESLKELLHIQEDYEIDEVLYLMGTTSYFIIVTKESHLDTDIDLTINNYYSMNGSFTHLYSKETISDLSDSDDLSDLNKDKESEGNDA